MSATALPQGLLFDLDGTLVDTAPDLAEATNRLREHHELARLPYEDIRAQVSNGGSALVTLAVGWAVDHPRHATAREFLLERYAQAVAEKSEVFPALVPLLTRWEAAGRPWGIVTNKPRRYAEPLIAALGLAPGVMLCADDLPVRKPDPAPLLEAARQIGVDAPRCWYIGDHRRDMEAANSAGMAAIAVRYGYIAEDDDIDAWPATQWFATPAELTDTLLALLEAR
ncbi:HAD-IA family hydrolase [Salinicola sp. V024]|uniref:HAD-IA family hydrolase n=1 Tax=unclassified Salinicola TaxID=2634022 RepID=UPI00094E6F10|nr:HAD-IA family hydrolase [Salinicola sp. MH3R3-1]OLO07837.1 phosphoglycolate phosphatase [Salinicola sp. MH3R3-1]